MVGAGSKGGGAGGGADVGASSCADADVNSGAGVGVLAGRVNLMDSVSVCSAPTNEVGSKDAGLSFASVYECRIFGGTLAISACSADGSAVIAASAGLSSECRSAGKDKGTSTDMGTGTGTDTGGSADWGAVVECRSAEPVFAFAFEARFFLP